MQSWGHMTDTEQNPERGPEGSREKLVAAAVELVAEHFEQGTGLRDVYSYLTPGAVADRAGLSRGLIYHHWGNVDAEAGDAFVSFLQSVSDEMWNALAVPDELTTLIPHLPDNTSDMIRELSDHELSRVTGVEGSLWRAVEMLLLHGVPVPGESLENDLARLAAFYELALAKVGREVVPPLGPRELANAIACVFEGFSFQVLAQRDRLISRHDWKPETEPETGDPGWTLLAITIESMVLRMTRPIQPQ